MGNNFHGAMCLQKKVSTFKYNFKIFYHLYRIETNTFCSDPNNVTGLCNRNSCPLANSRYSTVYEEKGVCYLKMKTAERAHTPKDLWENVKLNPSYNKALEQIDTELQYWPKFLVHKCKQRFTRLRQILVKRRKMKLEGSAEYRIVSHKAERREKSRLKKIEKSAMLENHVRNGLLQNKKNKKYDEIYNLNQKEFEKELENENDQEELDEDFNEEDYEPGYINDFSDEEGEEDDNEQEDNEDKDIDDIFNQKDNNIEEKNENDEHIKNNKKTGKKRKRVKYEVELERENTNKNVNYNMNINNLDEQDDYL